jgi:hypothetical protein
MVRVLQHQVSCPILIWLPEDYFSSILRNLYPNVTPGCQNYFFGTRIQFGNKITAARVSGGFMQPIPGSTECKGHDP